eukprot:8089327-Alexandrium_andersonii.AAC.1
MGADEGGQWVAGGLPPTPGKLLGQRCRGRQRQSRARAPEPSAWPGRPKRRVAPLAARQDK